MADNAATDAGAGDKRKREEANGALSNEEKQKKASRGVVVSLTCKDAKAVGAHIEQAFGELSTKPFFTFPKDDKIMHECRIVNGHHFYTDDADTGFLTSETLGLGGTKLAHVVISQFVDDAVKVAALAVENGAVEVIKVEKQFWGSTFGIVRDPQGVYWSLNSRDSQEDNTFSIHPSEKYNMSVELGLKNPTEEIEWLKKVFGGDVEGEVYKNEEGKMMHGVVNLNHGGCVYLCDLFGGREPGACINVTVTDGQAAGLAERLAADGGQIYMPVERQFWGAVYGRLHDKFGLDWAIMEPHGKVEQPAKTTKTGE